MHQQSGRFIENGQPTTTIEWGWAYQHRIIPMESEKAARIKVTDNGGRVVKRIKVQPPPLISAWIDTLTSQPDFIQRMEEEAVNE